MNRLKLIEYLKNAKFPEDNAPLVAFLGDSVTHGAFECIPGFPDCEFDFDAVYHRRFACEMAKYNRWLPVNVINAGIAGDTAHGALSRIDRDVISKHPDLCVLNFALNDVNGSLDDYVSSLGGLLDRLDAAEIPAVILTPNMLNSYVHPDTLPSVSGYAAVTAEYQKSGRMDAFVDAERELAARRNIPLADTYRRWKELEAAGEDTTLLLANYINHPTRDMHRLFVDALVEMFENNN